MWYCARGMRCNEHPTCVWKAWPEDALEMVAQKFLEDVEMQEAERTSVVVICKHFHESTRHTSEK